MSIELFIYLAGLTENLSVVFFMFALGCIFAAIGIVIAQEKWSMINTFFVIATISCLLISAALPSERTMYLMAGAHVGKELVNSETGKKVHTLVNQKLDELISKTANK